MPPSDGPILVSGLRLEGHSVIFLAIQTHLSCRLLLAVDSLGLRRSGYSSQIINQVQEFPEQFPRRRHLSTPVDRVRGVLADFPKIGIHEGWIPDVFASLPEDHWAFVHIDVDLYEPTKACLEYFFPRVSVGGVIINDDFKAPLFPGCGRAWQEFFDARQLLYIVLDTGQAVFMNPNR